MYFIVCITFIQRIRAGQCVIPTKGSSAFRLTMPKSKTRPHTSIQKQNIQSLSIGTMQQQHQQDHSFVPIPGCPWRFVKGELAIRHDSCPRTHRMLDALSVATAVCIESHQQPPSVDWKHDAPHATKLSVGPHFLGGEGVIDVPLMFKHGYGAIRHLEIDNDFADANCVNSLPPSLSMRSLNVSGNCVNVQGVLQLLKTFPHLTTLVVNSCEFNPDASDIKIAYPTMRKLVACDNGDLDIRVLLKLFPNLDHLILDDVYLFSQEHIRALLQVRRLELDSCRFGGGDVGEALRKAFVSDLREGTFPVRICMIKDWPTWLDMKTAARYATCRLLAPVLPSDLPHHPIFGVRLCREMMDATGLSSLSTHLIVEFAGFKQATQPLHPPSRKRSREGGVVLERSSKRTAMPVCYVPDHEPAVVDMIDDEEEL